MYVCMYFIWQNPFRLHIIIKSINRHFWIQTEDNTGKYFSLSCALLLTFNVVAVKHVSVI